MNKVIQVSEKKVWSYFSGVTHVQVQSGHHHGHHVPQTQPVTGPGWVVLGSGDAPGPDCVLSSFF